MSQGKSLRNLLIFLVVVLNIGILALWWADATTQYTLTKPFINRFVASPSEVKVEILDLYGGYNANTSRYDNVTVALRNIGIGDASGTLLLQLFDVNSTIIASGMKVVPIIAPQTTIHVNVVLTWQDNRTIVDFAWGLETFS